METCFWAKTGSGNLQENGRPKYHPVICHLADTAAVAMEIVRSTIDYFHVPLQQNGIRRGEARVYIQWFSNLSENIKG